MSAMDMLSYTPKIGEYYHQYHMPGNKELDSPMPMPQEGVTRFSVVHDRDLAFAARKTMYQNDVTVAADMFERIIYPQPAMNMIVHRMKLGPRVAYWEAMLDPGIDTLASGINKNEIRVEMHNFISNPGIDTLASDINKKENRAI